LIDTEETLVLIKPDAVERGLIGECIKRLERKGLEIKTLEMITVSRQLAEEHYAEHRNKDFFTELIEYITSSPVVAMRVSGVGAISAVRSLMGKVNPIDSPPGAIRGDLALTLPDNLIHGSDSEKSAKREIGLFFGT
jgi:nucleoside-diphosphate kinase